MKLNIKLPLVAATFAIIATNAALADDQQLRNRLALERAHVSPRVQRTTVAVYGTSGVGNSGVHVGRVEVPRTETRFELRSNAHGQQFGAYVPVK